MEKHNINKNKISVLVTAHSFIEKAGVDVYTENLFKYLIEKDKSVKYFFVVNSVSKKYFNIQSENVIIIQVSKMLDSQVGKILWYTFFAGRFIRKHKINLVFNNTATGNFVIVRKVPVISCLHDLAEFQMSNKYSAIKMFYRKHICLKINRYVTDQFIAISENTRRDMINYLGINSNKIAVIYNGADHLKEAKEFFSTGNEIKYLLYVGRLDPIGKNLLNLLDAFKIIANKYPGIYLYLVGNKFRGSEKVVDKIVNLGLSEKVKLFGYVDELSLSSLYANAEIFVFPSLYEGFGFPILEAMKFSIPVVCSGTSSLPEIGGDAAIYFDPYNPVSIADKIELVINNIEIRNNLKNKGLQQYQMFTWERCASETYMIFEHFFNYN